MNRQWDEKISKQVMTSNCWQLSKFQKLETAKNSLSDKFLLFYIDSRAVFFLRLQYI